MTQLEDLSAAFSREEVKRALFDLNPSKAPDLDGFTALFFKMLGTLWVRTFLMRFREFLTMGKHFLNGIPRLPPSFLKLKNLPP